MQGWFAVPRRGIPLERLQKEIRPCGMLLKVMSLANFIAMPRLVMTFRNCSSLAVGATSLSSLSLMMSEPPSNANSLVVFPP